MIVVKDIVDEIKELGTLNSLVQAYEQIASIRMKKTRESVLKSRNFLEEINKVFEEVRVSYIEEFKRIAKEKKARAGKVTLLSHNGKTVAVLLSANTGLYGEIIPDTFNMFAEEVKNSDAEVTVVGKYGMNLFQSEFPDKPVTFFEVPDHDVSAEDLNEVIKHIVQYEEIHVYHGSFVNVVKQEPDMLSVSAEIDISESREGKKLDYIFEPSLEEILMFFETQIFATMFDQTVREGQLAKFASRFMAMNRAQQNIDKSLKKLNLQKLRVAHKTENREQLNSLVPIYARLK